MRESTLSQAAQKNEAAKRILGWKDEISTRRQLLLAELKDLRHEDNGLEKRLHEVITDDQLDLFPGADVAMPKCLSDRSNLWTLIAQKDTTLRIFRVDVPGEKEPQYFMDLTHGTIRATCYVGGNQSIATVNAVSNSLERLKDANPKLRGKLEALKKDAPPPVPAIDFTRTLPTVYLTDCLLRTKKGEGEPIKPGDLPAVLESVSRSKPDVFIADFKGYVTVAMFGGTAGELDSAAVEVVPAEDWNWATVPTAAKAFDTRQMGLIFTASDGNKYVCQSWDTAIRIVATTPEPGATPAREHDESDWTAADNAAKKPAAKKAKPKKGSK